MILAIAIIVYNVVKLFVNLQNLDIVDVFLNQHLISSWNFKGTVPKYRGDPLS